MAHYLKFFIALAFGALGLCAYMVLPGWQGLAAFAGVFLFGSALASYIFKRIATREQVIEDLKARRRAEYD
ncbi:MAG TPA: hypothetical protein VMX97_10370 [Hyphomicrobiaceae bacterium]|nr:hypothetical protein [Hyphomicrobiaceae bacterium]